MRTLIRISAVAFALVGLATASAETYPDRPIKIVVPFPAGGGTDALTRQLATALTTKLNWVVTVDNKPGAGGNLALDNVAKAKPDGYTFVMAQTDNVVLNPLLYTKLSYDPVKDLEAVVPVASGAAVLVVRADSPYKTLADVVAAAKAKPGQLTVATPGTGTIAHLVNQIWQNASGVKFTHVPYRGMSQAIPDLIGGQVDMYMGSIPTLLAQIEGGKVRPLGVTMAKRSPVLPNVPTYSESGIKGVELASVWGLLAPAGTPKAIVDRWNTEVNAALKQPDVRDKIIATGADLIGGSPKALADRNAAERARLAPVVREAGIKLD
ncbi:tripartite-type tricarboxylate transporter receptor subunit TctC [Variovorax boronicumulans]|uniref:Tripartite-type tricarboxylate transporter receptor subunit TctC n=1 Tax=Variovorax boronicumulans TaxID=436515 RepID=A0AAW8DUN7_9BURK|nr:tripartite tricarboxylate transporter substrate binding protein [Variovorax boronicumulans]MDP9877966.1 tripartite-type tricarboxylate transporter receptor subunit TctC [Variovorax boronicumulans]MDP9923250.1 tripartite-type tricarboxylate transporter receptor subunit TctC [Variovorax boronicumulans]